MGVHPQPKRRRLLVSQPEDFRNNLRSTTWCQKFRVWGQPCPWADAVIAQWTLRYIKEYFHQAFGLLQVSDTLDHGPIKVVPAFGGGLAAGQEKTLITTLV